MLQQTDAEGGIVEDREDKNQGNDVEGHLYSAQKETSDKETSDKEWSDKETSDRETDL